MASGKFGKKVRVLLTRSGASDLSINTIVRMRTWKNKTSAPNCESNLRPSDDYFGSASSLI